MRRLLLLLFSVALIMTIAPVASAALELSGESIWRIGYGSRYYSSYGWKFALGGFLASQELRLDVKGEIIDGLFLEAHVDNTKGDIFQQLTVSLEWESLWAMAGNVYFAPRNALLSRAKSTVLGLMAGYDGNGISAYIAGGRAQGLKGNKTFRGTTASEDISYVPEGPYLPSRVEGDLKGALEGMYHAISGEEFDPAFDLGGLVLSDSSLTGPLADYLDVNGLADLLFGSSNPDGTLKTEEFIRNSMVDGLSGVSGAYVLLKGEPATVLRTALTDLIRQYNGNLGLTGDEALRYPYISGSPADENFLTGLLEGWTDFATASKATDEVKARMPYSSFDRGLLYPLGFNEVLGETMSVSAVTLEGTSVPLVAVSGANWICYEDRGYLEITLPPDFEDLYSHVIASFSYRLAGGIYFLGGGIVRGSVTATLDGKQLVDGQDFEVDYETGTLMLLIAIPADQEGLLEVEFEYAAYGSKAWIAGAGVTYKPIEGLSVSIEYGYGSDAPYLTEDESTVSRERSYENVVAAWADWRISEGLTLSGGASFSSSAFPGDMALRPYDFNGIRDIAHLEDNGGGIWWVFAHAGGVRALSPYGGGWSDISMPGSFASSTVNGLASYSGTWYFATNVGILSLSADYSGYGEGFSGIAALWKTATTKDGLPSSAFTSICATAGSILAGTPVGLVIGSADMEGPWTLRRFAEDPGIGEGMVTAVAPITGGFVVATEHAISFFDGFSFVRLSDEGAQSLRSAMLDSGPAVIASTADGALIISESLSYERIGAGRQLSDAAGHGGFAYYTCADGLFAYDIELGIEISLYSGPMSAVSSDAADVYSGGPADADYEITVAQLDYPVGEAELYGSDVHGIDGRDKGHYLPMEAAENTLSGFSGYLSLDYGSEKFDAAASLKLRDAGNVAGAGPGKPDTASASLSLKWRPNGILTLSLIDTFEAGGIFGLLPSGGNAKLSNNLQGSLSYKGPVTLNVFAGYNAGKGIGPSPEPESHYVSGSASASYGIGALRLAASLSASYRAAEGVDPYASAAATASAYLQAGKNTSISLSYIEPTPFGTLLSASGNYRSISGNVRYSAYMTYGSLSANLRGGYKWDVRNASDTADLSASMVYSARQINLFGIRFLPRTEIVLSYLMPIGADSRLTGLAKFSAGISSGTFGTDLSFYNKLTYMIESNRLTNSGDASISLFLNRADWILRPSLSIGAGYNIETPHYGPSTGSFKISAKASVSSGGAVPNQASASYAYSNVAGGRHELGLADSLSFTALAGRMGIGAGVNAGMSIAAVDIARSTYKAAVNGSLSYRFDKGWSGKFLAEVGIGSSALYEDPKFLYGLELTVTLKF